MVVTQYLCFVVTYLSPQYRCIVPAVSERVEESSVCVCVCVCVKGEIE